jgi:hypothetical protein
MIPFSWSNLYGWPRKPPVAHNVLATSQPLAAQVGAADVATGDNAVDAILATAITLYRRVRDDVTDFACGGSTPHISAPLKYDTIKR